MKTKLFPFSLLFSFSFPSYSSSFFLMIDFYFNCTFIRCHTLCDFNLVYLSRLALLFDMVNCTLEKKVYSTVWGHSAACISMSVLLKSCYVISQCSRNCYWIGLSDIERDKKIPQQSQDLKKIFPLNFIDYLFLQCEACYQVHTKFRIVITVW